MRVKSHNIDRPSLDQSVECDTSRNIEPPSRRAVKFDPVALVGKHGLARLRVWSFCCRQAFVRKILGLINSNEQGFGYESQDAEIVYPADRDQQAVV